MIDDYIVIFFQYYLYYYYTINTNMYILTTIANVITKPFIYFIDKISIFIFDKMIERLDIVPECYPQYVVCIIHPSIFNLQSSIFNLQYY